MEMLNCVLPANPSTNIMFNGDNGGNCGGADEPILQNVQITDIVDQYSQSCFNDSATATVTPLINPNELLHHQYHMLNNPNFFDPCVNAGDGELAFPPPPLMTDPAPAGFVLMPKLEYGCNIDFSNSLIGLDLVGFGRTYFSSEEDDFVNRSCRRSRQLDDGVMMYSPPCQVEGCNANLSYAKHYHRRHKVCEFHSKASTVFTGGLSQRFCQQCSRFHLVSEFDEGKRSCRKRLADHNRRRRKSSSHNEESKVVIMDHP